MIKEYIISNWEQDWDKPHIYYRVFPCGKVHKYDVIDDLLYEYRIEEVVQ